MQVQNGSLLKNLKFGHSLLNYGYSILRAATARALLGSGLLPNLGIFHKSRYNAFLLADDIWNHTDHTSMT